MLAVEPKLQKHARVCAESVRLSINLGQGGGNQLPMPSHGELGGFQALV